MTWSSQIISVGSSLFVLPLLLQKFSEIEISFWFLINVFIQLTMLADSGFGPTLVRAVSYFKAGANKLPKNREEFEKAPKELKNTNYKKLTDLLSTTRRIYNYVGWGAVILLCTVGVLIAWNIFELSDYRKDFAITYFLVIINSFLILQMVRWNSFMIGFDYVAKLSKLNTIVGFFRLIAFILILLISPSVLYLIIFNVISSIFTLYFIRKFILTWFSKHNCELHKERYFDKEIFDSIWSATWKMGGIQWGNYLISYGTSIIIAQVNNTTLMANFLLTQRIIFIFKRISEVPFFANIQKVYALIAQKKYDELKKLISKYIFLEVFILSSLLLGVALFGNMLLSFLDIETRLVSFWILIVMALSINFEVHANIHLNIYISTNQIPFLLPILISGVIFVILGFIILPYYGLLGVVIVQLIVQLSFDYWFPVKLSFKLINWNLRSYISDLYNFGFKSIYHQIARIIATRSI